jgi:surfactin family lipopeptide synthetase A
LNSLAQFLSDLRSLGVLLSVEGERLHCNAPKGALTPALRQQLAERKSEILQFLSQSGSGSSRAAAATEELPLSHAQQRLWIFTKMNADNPVYNVPIALQLTGQMDQDALEKALHYLVQRHEALRTSFHESNGKPYAHVALNPPFSVQFLDVLGQTPVADTVRELILREARKPFQLEQAPLFRATVVQLDERRSLLLLVAHHIVADGWSLGVLAGELGVSYTAFATGQAPPLPPLIAQYRDFVVWEQSAGEQLAREQLPYWRELLRGPVPVLELSSDRRRPALQSFQGCRLPLHLDAILGAGVRKLASRTGTTPFIVMLAAFKALMYRYTGQDDLVVGTGTSNRHRQEFSPLVGFFVNMLVLRTDLSGDLAFLEIVERVKQTAHAAYAHQDVSFNLLLEELQPKRSVNQSPLVQVAFTMQNVPMGTISLPGLDVETVPFDAGISRLDLSVEVWPEGECFRCDFEFSHDLFDEGMILALQSHYKALLSAAVFDPSQRLHALPLLSPQERITSLLIGNRTSTKYPQLPIPAVFASCASAAPAALAIRSDAGDFTYSELDGLSNAIAQFLMELRLPPHSFIAVAAEGSPLAITAFLAVLKAGHAYMPIPTGQPAARIAGMVKRAKVEVLLHLAENAAVYENLMLPHQRILEDFLGATAPESPVVSINLDDPAYLMFTSGSTGEPKGVVVSHRGIVRLVCGVDYVELSSAETVGQFASLAFDASTWEIWAALLNGGTLAIVGQRDAEHIAAAIQRFGITSVLLTTALFHYMVEHRPEGLSPLRQVLTGGDVLSIAHVHRLLAVAPHLRLLNAYGPTENTTITTCQHITPQTLERGIIPIGRPISNTRVYILDKYKHPVPRGVPGELFAAGDGLALGYLDNHEETVRRFTTLQLSEVPDERVYATGDIARFLDDGAIEFLGRADEQIKLRGYRIELEEVQQVLLAIPGVRAAVVAVRRGPGEEERLVAYVVPQPGLALDPQQLRVAARKTLPEFQVPAAFLLLDEIPRTSNDKIDHLDAGVRSLGGR